MKPSFRPPKMPFYEPSLRFRVTEYINYPSDRVVSGLVKIIDERFSAVCQVPHLGIPIFSPNPKEK